MRNGGPTRTAQVVATGDGEEVKVLRNQEYQAKSMSLEEAVLQLDLLADREFFVFTNDGFAVDQYRLHARRRKRRADRSGLNVA